VGPDAARRSVARSRTVWDEAFVAEEPDDPAQLSLPNVSWSVTRDEDGVQRIDGYGRVSFTVEDGKVVLVLGNNEHRLDIAPARSIDYTELVASEATKKTEAKPTKPVEAKRGALGDAALRERLQHIKRIETLLAVYVLERAHKSPRGRVLKALNELAESFDDMRFFTDAAAIDEGRTPSALVPDLAAGVLITSNSKAPTSLLELFVPDCKDAIVLGWILDDEKERGEHARNEVISVVSARLAEMIPEPAANEGDEQESAQATDPSPVVH
jgi:hypothetical protein